MQNNNNTEWEHVGKDRKTFLQLSINASVIVNVIDYVRGISPAEAEEQDLDPKLHVTEVNKYGKYPNSFTVKVVSQDGNFEPIPMDKKLTWNSKCPDSYDLLDRLERGNIPDTKHGVNACKIKRLSERDHKILIPSAKDQLYKPNEMDDGE